LRIGVFEEKWIERVEKTGSTAFEGVESGVLVHDR